MKKKYNINAEYRQGERTVLCNFWETKGEDLFGTGFEMVVPLDAPLSATTEVEVIEALIPAVTSWAQMLRKLDQPENE